MEFKLKNFHYNVSDQDFLDDLKLVCVKLGQSKIGMREYDEAGKFSSGTIHRRFGTWNNALKAAGIELTSNKVVSELELFENLEQVWIAHGRQPTDREMRHPLSKFSKFPYLTKFGTWRKALEAFIKFINSESSQKQELEQEEITIKKNNEHEIVFKHKTKRTPSERLKVEVLMRDGNKCKLCGITVTGENIHFDHIHPWSKGGETILGNMQVLCEKHNLAKGNYSSNDTSKEV